MFTRTVQKSPGAGRDNTELIAAMEATIEWRDRSREAAVKLAGEERLDLDSERRMHDERVLRRGGHPASRSE
jgi:hypothetical protein